MEELHKLFKHTKNRRNPGLDKFGGHELKLHILEQFHNIVDKNHTGLPKEWAIEKL
jgi:hypothetical protein